MILDIAYKLVRKNLPLPIYEKIQNSMMGRRNYFNQLSWYHSIVEKYKQYFDFKNKIVMEIGSGAQIYSGIEILNLGASKVILVEPKITYQKGDNDIICVNSIKELFIAHNYKEKIDIILSHFVLEHIENLEDMINSINILLKKGGRTLHIVDLSDHTYHIFEKFPFTKWIAKTNRMTHLNYSSKVFSYLNDPKCFMNRVLLPEYLMLFSRYGFRIIEVRRHLAKEKFNIHKELQKKNKYWTTENLNITGFELFAVKQ